MRRTTRLLSSTHRGATETLSYRMQRYTFVLQRQHFTLNHNSEMLPFLWHEKSLLDNLLFFSKNEQQAERQKVEQAAQASRASTMYADAEQQIFTLEHMVRDANAKTEESSQPLSRSVSAVYALEGETCPIAANHEHAS